MRRAPFQKGNTIFNTMEQKCLQHNEVWWRRGRSGVV